LLKIFSVTVNFTAKKCFFICKYTHTHTHHTKHQQMYKEADAARGFLLAVLCRGLLWAGRASHLEAVRIAIRQY